LKRTLLVLFIIASKISWGQSIQWASDRPGNVNAFDILKLRQVAFQVGISSPLTAAGPNKISVGGNDLQFRVGALQGIEFGGGVSFGRSVVADLPIINNEYSWQFEEPAGIYAEIRMALPHLGSFHHNLHVKAGYGLPFQANYNFGFPLAENWVLASTVNGGFELGQDFSETFSMNTVLNIAYLNGKMMYYVEGFSGGWLNAWAPGVDAGIAYALDLNYQVDLYLGYQTSNRSVSESSTLFGGIGFSFAF